MQEETKKQEEQTVQEDNQVQNNTTEETPATDTVEEVVSENLVVDSEESIIEKLQAEIKEQNDKFLRLFAEFDNFKKRSAKEKRELSLVAGQDIMKDLLPIFDDYKRANKSFETDNNKENLAEGLQLIFDKFIKIVQNKGLKEIESIGTPFNVEQHEAIAEIPAPTEEQKGKVIDEVQSGYTLNGTIIRYAKVVVGN